MMRGVSKVPHDGEGRFVKAAAVLVITLVVTRSEPLVLVLADGVAATMLSLTVTVVVTVTTFMPLDTILVVAVTLEKPIYKSHCDVILFIFLFLRIHTFSYYFTYLITSIVIYSSIGTITSIATNNVGTYLFVTTELSIV